MFDSLSDKLQGIFSGLKGKGKLSEKDVELALREIRMALLEADVNYKVVKDLVSSIKERAIGSEVMESLTPGQMVVKIVNEELTNLMGESQVGIKFSSSPTTVILMCGLQGAGKTTHTGKLALHLMKQKKKPLLVACDVYRPAAIKQLEVVASKINVPVFQRGTDISPVKIAEEGLEFAKKNGHDLVIIDTAGRLHVDETLMDELKNIKAVTKADEILLVVDAMTGQDAVNVAETFDSMLDITGVVLTKLDGDARGGAALSIRKVTNKPIKFIGVGEKMEDLEPFHPDRMASRILGMGDVLTLIEKAQQSIDMKNAKDLEEKIRTQSYDFNDYLQQLEQMRNLGPLEDILKMIPGVNNKMLQGLNIDERDIKRIEAIILSMTNEEREKPELIDVSRKKRIALGSGTNQAEVSKLIKQFRETKKLMKKFTGMEKSMKKKKGRFNLPFFK